jgi:hypothetical protein
MTWLNHAATGAAIATAIDRPIVALPAAFLSHFVIDVIPHWDFKFKGNLREMQAGRLIDINLALIFLIIVIAIYHGPAGLILASGLIAILPDAIFLPYFTTGKITYKFKSRVLKSFNDFSLAIQKSETRGGIFVELGWFILMNLLIFYL